MNKSSIEKARAEFHGNEFSAPEKQPPTTSAALCERLRQLSEEIHTLSEAMRQLAGNNKQLQDNGRQLWSFAAMPKIWAEKIEEGNAI